jgi:hypothetical protein
VLPVWQSLQAAAVHDQHVRSPTPTQSMCSHLTPLQFDKTSGKGPFLDTTTDAFEAHVNAAYTADPENCLKWVQYNALCWSWARLSGLSAPLPSLPQRQWHWLTVNLSRSECSCCPPIALSGCCLSFHIRVGIQSRARSHSDRARIWLLPRAGSGVFGQVALGACSVGAGGSRIPLLPLVDSRVLFQVALGVCSV